MLLVEHGTKFTVQDQDENTKITRRLFFANTPEPNLMLLRHVYNLLMNEMWIHVYSET